MSFQNAKNCVNLANCSQRRLLLTDAEPGVFKRMLQEAVHVIE
jgi:hypothetical protein